MFFISSPSGKSIYQSINGEMLDFGKSNKMIKSGENG